ncbi:MAG: hypothetical protein KKA55_11300 [Proteobacteria bacterium]|nr:hypothetical protein [Pseudomonadota bacterium]MBU1596103.1 hypothetical protein [Pseudomonadota bacterium]
MAEIPDLNWYKQVSERQGLSVRCPHATADTCPRYYQSLSLLGQAGSTAIPITEDKRLLKFWQKSDLWPKTDEQTTSLCGYPERWTMFSQFCPEVAFDRFGFFASYLARYSDEIDSGVAHKQLQIAGAPVNDPRWNWATCSPQHYSECSLYPVLLHHAITAAKPATGWHIRFLEFVTNVFGTCVGGLLQKLLGW